MPGSRRWTFLPDSLIKKVPVLCMEEKQTCCHHLVWNDSYTPRVDMKHNEDKSWGFPDAYSDLFIFHIMFSFSPAHSNMLLASANVLWAVWQLYRRNPQDGAAGLSLLHDGGEHGVQVEGSILEHHSVLLGEKGTIEQRLMRRSAPVHANETKTKSIFIMSQRMWGITSTSAGLQPSLLHAWFAQQVAFWLILGIHIHETQRGETYSTAV